MPTKAGRVTKSIRERKTSSNSNNPSSSQRVSSLTGSRQRSPAPFVYIGSDASLDDTSQSTPNDFPRTDKISLARLNEQHLVTIHDQEQLQQAGSLNTNSLSVLKQRYLAAVHELKRFKIECVCTINRVKVGKLLLGRLRDRPEVRVWASRFPHHNILYLNDDGEEISCPFDLLNDIDFEPIFRSMLQRSWSKTENRLVWLKRRISVVQTMIFAGEGFYYASRPSQCMSEIIFVVRCCEGDTSLRMASSTEATQRQLELLGGRVNQQSIHSVSPKNVANEEMVLLHWDSSIPRSVPGGRHPGSKLSEPSAFCPIDQQEGHTPSSFVAPSGEYDERMDYTAHQRSPVDDYCHIVDHVIPPENLETEDDRQPLDKNPKLSDIHSGIRNELYHVRAQRNELNTELATEKAQINKVKTQNKAQKAKIERLERKLERAERNVALEENVWNMMKNLHKMEHMLM